MRSTISFSSSCNLYNDIFVQILFWSLRINSDWPRVHRWRNTNTYPLIDNTYDTNSIGTVCSIERFKRARRKNKIHRDNRPWERTLSIAERWSSRVEMSVRRRVFDFARVFVCVCDDEITNTSLKTQCQKRKHGRILYKQKYPHRLRCPKCPRRSDSRPQWKTAWVGRPVACNDSYPFPCRARPASAWWLESFPPSKARTKQKRIRT